MAFYTKIIAIKPPATPEELTAISKNVEGVVVEDSIVYVENGFQPKSVRDVVQGYLDDKFAYVSQLPISSE